MKKFILAIVFPLCLYAQPPENRYVAPIFSNVIETNNIVFSQDVPQPNPGGGFYEFITGYPLNVSEYNTTDIDLLMDVFEPSGDTLSARPLIIICFGGGFLSGSRNHWSIRLLCQELAKRGFVTAAIDYRLGMNIFDADLSTRAVYRGLQDGRSAVRYFRADANGTNTYRIDPNQIYIGGHSSGGFIALHNAYLDKESERPASTYNWIQDGMIIPDLQCLDCVGNNTSQDGHADAIFNLAGAIGFTSFIENANDPKAVLFHSTDDSTVPYDSGTPFSSLLWLVVGADLPTVYGSLPISNQVNNVGIPYEFHSYTDREHGVHEDGSSALYDDIVPSISDWFFEEMLKPNYQKILGDSLVCDSELTQTYFLPPGNGHYFDWQVNGGTVQTSSTSSDTIVITWDSNASTHSLKVTPYSILDARGDTLELNINIGQNETNSYTFHNDIWEDVNNWSLVKLPSFCTDVIISQNTPDTVYMNSSATINSLLIDTSQTLEFMPEANLQVYQKQSLMQRVALRHYGSILNQGTLRIMHKINGFEFEGSNSTILNLSTGNVIFGKEY